MDFPVYVPAAVRKYLADYLEGESDRDIPGYIELLAKAEAAIAGIERAIECYARRGEDDYLGSLREQKSEAIKHRDMLANGVECLQRLAHDKRMREAFDLLSSEFSNDEQWRGFIRAAWAARMDYKPYRERLKQAKKLRDEIVDTSEKLAQLLRDISTVGLSDWPSELFSIPELLRNTDNHEMQDHNLQMWRSKRHYVLGDLPRRDEPEKELAQPTRKEDSTSAPEIVWYILKPGEKPEIDPEEANRNSLRYIWGLAPELSALLETVSKAAREFNPREYGMIGTAIVSRQQSVKTEYLRAFANLLNINLTTIVMKAMAIVANVAINLPDVDVTYDDVRKALVKLSGEPLENSRGK